MQPSITGIILAGGRGRRLGGQDKGLLPLESRPLVEHVLTRLRPQVVSILINANRNLAQYSRFGVPVITDRWPNYPGPLAGILAGMSAARTEYILIVPCDCPSLPLDLAARLSAHLRMAQAPVVAYDGMRLQPLFALLSRGLSTDLHAFLESGGRKVEDWLHRHPYLPVDFSDQPEAFVNINTAADLTALQPDPEPPP